VSEKMNIEYQNGLRPVGAYAPEGWKEKEIAIQDLTSDF